LTSTQNASVWLLTATAPSDSVFCALYINRLTYLFPIWTVTIRAIIQKNTKKWALTPHNRNVCLRRSAWPSLYTENLFSNVRSNDKICGNLTEIPNKVNRYYIMWNRHYTR